MMDIRSFLSTITVAILATASLGAMDREQRQQPAQQQNFNNLRFTIECQHDGVLIEGVSYQALMLSKQFKCLFTDLGDCLPECTVIPVIKIGTEIGSEEKPERLVEWVDSRIMTTVLDCCEFIVVMQQEGKPELDIRDALCRNLKDRNDYEALLRVADFYDFEILVKVLKVCIMIQKMKEHIAISQEAMIPEYEIIQELCKRFRLHPDLEKLLDDAHFYEMPLLVKAIESLINSKNKTRQVLTRKPQQRSFFDSIQNVQQVVTPAWLNYEDYELEQALRGLSLLGNNGQGPNSKDEKR